MEASLQNWVDERTLLPDNSSFVKKLMERFFHPIGLERRAREIIANSIVRELETPKDSLVYLPYLKGLCNTLEKISKKKDVLKVKSEDTVTNEEITKEIVIKEKDDNLIFIAREIDKDGNIISEASITKRNNSDIQGNRLIINSGEVHIDSDNLPLSAGKVFAFISQSVISAKK